jgi:hypothetical protein
VAEQPPKIELAHTLFDGYLLRLDCVVVVWFRACDWPLLVADWLLKRFFSITTGLVFAVDLMIQIL